MAKNQKTEADHIVIEKAGERRMRVVLTQEELNAVHDESAQTRMELKQAENDLQTMSKQMKAKIGQMEAKLDELDPIILQKADYRKVEVVKELNFTQGTVQYRRLDLDEVFDRRKMYEDEKQLGLTLEEDIDRDAA